jgi:hypothetical protein
MPECAASFSAGKRGKVNSCAALPNLRVAKSHPTGRNVIMHLIGTSGVENAGTVERDRVNLQIFYDTPPMHAAAAVLGERLTRIFASDLEVYVQWNQLQQLADRHHAREAAEAAARAEVVIVATACLTTLPGTVARWLGLLMCQRQRRESVLCGLFPHEPGGSSRLPPAAAILSATARLIGRDWIMGYVPSPVILSANVSLREPVTEVAVPLLRTRYRQEGCPGKAACSATAR